MTHLGERLTALVDGELGHGERDRVLAHLAGCAECRHEADALRALKRRIHHLDGPAPSPELMSRLLGMAEPGEPLPPRPRPLPGTARSRRPGYFATRPDDRRPSARAGSRHVRPRYVAVGAVSLVALALGTAFYFGGGDDGPAPSVTPPVELYAVEHALTTGDLLINDPGSGGAPTPGVLVATRSP